MENVSKGQVRGAVEVLCVLSETIREAKEIPSGVLYSHVMGLLSLESYQSAIGVLKRTKLVEERGNLLKWVGPALEG